MKLLRIDDLVRRDHCWLEKSHHCSFLREYTSGQKYDFSETNQLIKNLKIPPAVKKDNPRRWRYKEKAIAQIAAEFCRALAGMKESVKASTLTWIPPHLTRDEEGYDDRMEQVVGIVAGWAGSEPTELLVQKSSLQAAHTGQSKRRPPLFQQNYRFAVSASRQLGPAIVVFDDVITTGAHFVAFYNKLKSRWPRVPVLGLFVARRVFPDVDESE